MSKRKGRKTNTPGIISLGHKSYRVRARSVDPRTGKTRDCERVIHDATMTEARAAKHALVDEIQGARGGDERRTLGDYGKKWLRGQWNSLCPTTRNRYLNALDRHILPALGDMFLDAIRVEDVELWRDELRRSGLAKTTVNGHLQVLRSVLRRAVVTEGLRMNAAAQAKTLPADDTRINDDEPDTLDAEEVRRFLAAARDNYPQHYAMILVLFTTGARMSAVRALRWEDVDVERGVIWIRRRISAGEVVAGVKRSRTSKDLVPLHPELLEALEAHWRHLSPVQLDAGWLFSTADGRPRSGAVLNKPFQAIRKIAGITKRFTPNGCRRTSTDLYRRASSEVVTKAITGHLTSRMHAHYSTVSAAEKQAAARLAFSGILDERGDSDGDPTHQVGTQRPTAGGANTPSGRHD